MGLNKKPEYPVDIVISWVDGNDTDWLAEKNQYNSNTTTSVHSYNYQDWDLLKFFFRGIEKSAPWVRKVYFVTWGHRPSWLNERNPKLVIVNHKDFIPEKYLPTFSSHTIELNFHRLPGLAEHFIYFNDDMFLVRATKSTDFFENGLPCETAIINPIAPISRYRIAHLKLTNIAVINEHFKKHKVIMKHFIKWFNVKYGPFLLLNMMFVPWGRFPGMLENHLTTSFLKETFIEVWNQEEQLLDETCSHKFRDFRTDVNQWLLKEWQVMEGKFSPRSYNWGRTFYITSIDEAKKAARVIRKKKYKMVCINDNFEGSEEDLREIKSLVQDAFQAIYPQKSCFEK